MAGKRDIGSLTTSEYTCTSLSTVTKLILACLPYTRPVLSCLVLFDLLYTLLCNKVSSYSHSKPFSFLVYHEVVSNTCVVHHRDLRGLPTGGEQPHLRESLHQFRGKHCVPTVG